MFRFTIRDVLWLTAVVAVGCALCLNELAWRVHALHQWNESKKHLEAEQKRQFELHLKIVELESRIWHLKNDRKAELQLEGPIAEPNP
jgi:hypothetical protein